MTYRNSTATGGVAVDGNPDAIGTTVPQWHLTTGPQGSIMEADALDTTIIPAGGAIDDVADGFYIDDDDTTVDQCWGDPDFLGTHGTSFVTAIPNTDPAAGHGGDLPGLRLDPLRGAGRHRRAGGDVGDRLAHPAGDQRRGRGPPVDPPGSWHGIRRQATDSMPRTPGHAPAPPRPAAAGRVARWRA